MVGFNRAFKCMAVVVGLALVGCGGQTTSDADVSNIEMEPLTERMNEPGTVVVDVRAPHRYQRGHLPQAINIPYSELRPGDSRLSGAETIIVYSGGWTDPLAKPAAKRLVDQGYKDVRTFLGGTELWQDSGRELATARSGDDDVTGRPDTEN